SVSCSQVHGLGRDVWKPYGQNYATTPGTGPAEQRLKEQDIDGIDAEVLFPGQASGPYFWRYIRDDEAYKACVRAYNDFLAEDYCSVAPDRLILIEAPSSAYHGGMLNWEKCSLANEEETSCDSTPNSTNFIVVSTCMLAPCTSVS